MFKTFAFRKIAFTTVAIALVAGAALGTQTTSASAGMAGGHAANAVFDGGTLQPIQVQGRHRPGWGHRPPPPGWGHRPRPGWGYRPVRPPVYRPAPVYHRPAPWSPAWYRYCRSKYRSFNPNTGYFTAYSGHQRFCR